MSNVDTSICTAVANKVKVGETGSPKELNHNVAEAVTKRIVLQTIETDLCPSHAAIAFLVVDGRLKAHGDISAKGSAIETGVSKGQTVYAIVHAVPVPNDVVCVRLGDVTVSLFDCGIVQ